MIIITGPGRSGTSALALLYKELGFDPGGSWIPEYRAGLEHGDFWGFNNDLATAMGATMFRPTKKQREESAGGGKSRVKFMKWDRLPDVVATYGEQMCERAAANPVVKDPRFLFTLPLWLAAGAQIEHVVITCRAIEDAVASRQAAGQSEFNELELRNALTYGMGIITQAVLASGLSHSFIRFPDFLTNHDALYDALRFPGPVDKGAFVAAAHKVFELDQVHDWSGRSDPAG